MFLVTLVIALCVFQATNSEPFNRICYFANWPQVGTWTSRSSFAIASTPIEKFSAEHVDTALCTHVVYGFAQIVAASAHTHVIGGSVNSSKTAKNKYDTLKIDNWVNNYDLVSELKLANSSLKVLLAVGGPSAGTFAFETIVDDRTRLHHFCKQVVRQLNKWNFDGLVVSWMYPIQRRQSFTKFIRSLRLALDSSSRPLMLSIDVSANGAIIDASYEVESIVELVDMVNLNAFEYRFPSTKTETRYHTALYPGRTDTHWQRTYNADWAVDYWLKKGCPRNKLNLGIPFYGKKFTPPANTPSPVNSRWRMTTAANSSKSSSGVDRLPFFEICPLLEALKNNHNLSVERFDMDQKVAYISLGRGEQMSYESIESVMIKGEYISRQRLAGFVAWGINYDDFQGAYCQQMKYPLLRSLNSVLIDESNESVNENDQEEGERSETVSKSEDNSTSTSEQSNKSMRCSNKTELLADTTNCHYFHVCLANLIGEPVAILKCPDNLWFDPKLATCSHRMPPNCSSSETPHPASVSASKPLIEFKCLAPSGLFANAQDCGSFWQCSNWRAIPMPCPLGLEFNELTAICDYGVSPTCSHSSSNTSAINTNVNTSASQ